MALIAGGLWVAIEKKIDGSERRCLERVDTEIQERKRDIERIDTELAGFADVRKAVGDLSAKVGSALQQFQTTGELIGVKVQALAERFGDFRDSSEKSTETITHTLRNLEQKSNALAVAQARQEGRDEV